LQPSRRERELTLPPPRPKKQDEALWGLNPRPGRSQPHGQPVELERPCKLRYEDLRLNPPEFKGRELRVTKRTVARQVLLATHRPHGRSKVCADARCRVHPGGEPWSDGEGVVSNETSLGVGGPAPPERLSGCPGPTLGRNPRPSPSQPYG